MRVKEFIDYVKSNTFCSLCDMEDSIESDLKISIKKVAKNLEPIRHRWFELSTTVYKLEDGFVGVRGASTIYSEDLDAEDCCIKFKCTACEYKEIKKGSYKRK